MKSSSKKKWEPEIFIGQIILIVFVISSALQVVMRCVFNNPLSWPEELSSVLLVGLVFIGATAISKGHNHVRVEILEDVVSEKFIRWLHVLYDIVIIVYLGFIVVGGWELFQRLQYSRTPALRLPVKWVTVVVPITSGIMVIYYVKHIVREILHSRRSSDGY